MPKLENHRDKDRVFCVSDFLFFSKILAEVLDQEREGCRQNHGPALLDGARAEGMRSRFRGLQRGAGARSAGRAATLPLPGRWHDGDGSRSPMEGDEEGWKTNVPATGRAARYPDHDGMD